MLLNMFVVLGILVRYFAPWVEITNLGAVFRTYVRCYMFMCSISHVYIYIYIYRCEIACSGDL